MGLDLLNYFTPVKTEIGFILHTSRPNRPPREKSGVSKRNWNPVHNDCRFSLLSRDGHTSSDDVCPRLRLSGILLLHSLFYQLVNTDQTVAAKTAEETRW